MLDEARRITANEWIEQMRIQAISIQDSEYFKRLLEHYQSLIPVTPDEQLRMYEASEASILSPKEANAKLQALLGMKGQATDGERQNRIPPRP